MTDHHARAGDETTKHERASADAVASHPASGVDEDDPHKVEKLARAGRDIDPDEGSD